MDEPYRSGVTVIVPTFDRGRLVERAIDSILAQTRPPDAVVVVDDGSRDDTPQRLARYGDKIQVVTQANLGASRARNRGVEECSTEWVAFCDSDDHWVPDHLDRLMQAVAATDGRAALYFDDTAIDEADGGGRFFEAAGLRFDGPMIVAEPVVAWTLGTLQPMLLQSSIVRTSVFRAVGGLATQLTVRHDTHLFFRLGFRYPMCAVAGVGGHLSADAGPDGRLTDWRTQKAPGGWIQSVWMYEDLGRQAPDHEVRVAMRDRLAGTHIRVGMMGVRSHEWRTAARHLTRGVVTSPREVLRLASRGVRRRVARRPRRTGRIPRVTER